MDVQETDKDINVTCELPGVEQKDVEITLAEGLLTIKGEKKSEKDEKKAGMNSTAPSLGTEAPSSERQAIRSFGRSSVNSASHPTVRPSGALAFQPV